jgi:hypothetical protein
MDLSKGWMSILLYHGEGLVSVDSNGMSHTLLTRLYSTWNTHLRAAECLQHSAVVLISQKPQ